MWTGIKISNLTENLVTSCAFLDSKIESPDENHLLEVIIASLITFFSLQCSRPAMSTTDTYAIRYAISPSPLQTVFARPLIVRFIRRTTSDSITANRHR